MWLTGLVAPRHVGSSQTRARTRVPCIGRQILNHCATREALNNSLSSLRTLTNHQKLGDLTEIYSLTVLEARNLKPRCQQGCAPHHSLNERICSLPLPASGGCWHSLACGSITPGSAFTTTTALPSPPLLCVSMSHLPLSPT